MTLLDWLRRLLPPSQRPPLPKPVPRPLPKPAPPPGTVPGLDPVQLLMLALINRARETNGLPPYVWSDPLGHAATGHAAHMARTGRLGHFGIGDGTPWDRIKAAGYAYLAATENLAAGQQTAEETVNDWLTLDPGHRAAILGPYRHAGTAMATSPSGVRYWVAVFASPLPQP